MTTYYVREQGAVIHKIDERLSVSKDKKPIAVIPLHDLTQLVVVGNVQLTTQTMRVLMQRRVDTVFMTRSGKVEGRAFSNEAGQATLRLRQMQVALDPALSLRVAKSIVFGKLNNQRHLLEEAAKAEAKAKWRGLPAAAEPASDDDDLVITPPRGGLGAVQKAASSIAQMMGMAGGANNADSLRGYEGKGGAYYWPAFRDLLKNDMGFRQRIYHPSPDPINALLSFCYTLLLKDVLTAVRIVGMDPYIGFFHTPEQSRQSLALDLMEEFRPLLVDRIVLQLVNQGRITERDFVRESSTQKPLVLAEGALKRVIVAYETRATSLVRYPASGEMNAWRRCIELQARHLARVLKGEEMQYVPMMIDPRMLLPPGGGKP
jgi:CRISPR-associated protein Cas1